MQPAPSTAARPPDRIQRLLRPRSVAIVGASSTPGSFGASVLANLERSGYAGDLYLINPKRSKIGGRPCLPSAEALPLGVECAVLAIPRAAVLETLRACARRKVGSAVIFSAGFAESGAAGRAEQDDIARLAREHDMAILGPNCLGLVNYAAQVALTFVSTPAPAPDPGSAATLGIVSQSGAMAAVLIVALAARGLGLAAAISTGNEAVCGAEDFVEVLIDDPRAQAVTMIVEQFRAPRRFLALVERAHARGKRIVLLHPGRSRAARASAGTHTGAMAGDYETMRTLVTAAGVIVVDTLEELVDVSEILLRSPALRARLPQAGAAVLTESGAFKALTLDLCEHNGMELPAFTSATDAALRALLPDFIPPTNPMDLTAHALVDTDLYWKTLPLIIADERVGSLVLTIILTDESTCDLKFRPILAALNLLQQVPQGQSPGRGLSKPIIFAGMDEGARVPPLYVEELRKLGVPFFASPERALQALAVITRAGRAEACYRPAAPVQAGPRLRRPARDASVASAALQRKVASLLTAGAMPEYRGKAVLKVIGIPVPGGTLAHSLEAAQAIARHLGYPAVLKAQAAALTHKSDAGGVVLNLNDAAALAAAWARLYAELAHARPQLTLDGVLVESMAKPGVELIVGARRDPDWGPVLLAGFGGVLAEARRDVRVFPTSLSREAIAAELLQLEGAALLRGFRGSPPLDVRAAADIAFRLGVLMRSADAIIEIDINPVVVYPEGQGALALDALIVTAS